ncbi:RCC1/BLIP-II [Pleurotus eryngii]|uniref:RCC1/BLIP-II n=1 Tax=Pleurotus eryngii TaxID=5323 RepID=A0A9P6A685_PLEER|nr:RCC1/BLIP-II [Pleurotus eryngii]
MFRQAARGSLRGALKGRAYSTGQGSKRISRKVPGVLLASAFATTLALNSVVVYNDAPAEQVPEQRKKANDVSSVSIEDQDGLNSIVWGSNKSGVLDPKAVDVNSFRTPTVVAWLQNVALRDLALHQKHAACVDARGDVYQWGEGFFSAENKDGKPTLTLRGKNIVSLQLTEGRVYALSASGKVYVLASDAATQFLPVGKPTPASTPWWSTGWMWGEEEDVDFAEVTPNCQLARGEKIASISAGEHHLLALTSAGRTFAHPVTKDANAYGQLGLRKLDIPDHSERLHVGPHAARKTIELVPKSITDPYAKSSPYTRTSTPLANQVEAIADTSIRFCDKLYEIPSLKGIEIAQIAAGGRSSFARTSTGRVLGWGANEFGQIGLGNNYKLDTVIIPTEVVLWQYTSNKTTSQCLNVTAGGDLTCFAVERKGEENIDVLMCGNGQYGGLGNNLYTNSQGAPLRAKNVSGLQEYNEATKSPHAISPHSISVSPSGHVLLTLNADMNVGGRDLMVWGKNHDSELGNGKKGSSPLPSALTTTDGQRFMLMARTANHVVDLQGKLWKRGVKVEQRAVAGYGNSIVYWRLC